jgi:hypothetical protein
MIQIPQSDDSEEELEVTCLGCGDDLTEDHVCAELPPLSVNVSEEVGAGDRFGG